MNILFVCLGNICRSPIAEGLMRHKINHAGLTAGNKVESVGFEPFHRGDAPDPRAQEVCRRRGIDISDHRARLFETDDFDRFDRIYVMDNWNYGDVTGMARNESDKAIVDFAMNLVFPGQNKAVPDPWYGGIKDFEHTYTLLDQVTDVLLKEIKS